MNSPSDKYEYPLSTSSSQGHSGGFHGEDSLVYRLAAIVESSTDAIIGKTLGGTVTSWNSAAEQLYGYTVREMIGKSITRLIPPAQQEEFERMMENIRKGQAIRRHETERVHKDGRYLNVSLTISPIKTPSGIIIGAATIAHDITEQKKLLERLRQQEATSSYLAAIVESSTDAIIGKTLGGAVTSWNSAAEQLYGYTAREMIGKSITRLIPPAQQEEFKRMMENIRKGQAIRRHETVRVHKDGRYLNVSLTISPIKTPSGIVIGAATTAHDIIP